MSRPLFLLLIASVVIAQVCCARPESSSESIPAASQSPTEREVVDKILDRYEEAIGGKDAGAAITSYRLKGTFELQHNIPIDDALFRKPR